MSSGWDSKETIMFGANAFAMFRLCSLLIEKGVLTQPEASSVMTQAANDIRSGSEDGPEAAFGEATSRSFEKLAGWLQGMDPKL